MGIFNYIGLFVIILMMIPNVVFALTNKDGFNNLYKNKKVEILEQVGRYGCFIFMMINVPYTYFNFWFNNAKLVYIIINFTLVFLYLLFWIVFWKKSMIIKSLVLSILPSIIFIFSGIMLQNILLIFFAIVFVPTHIHISYKNSKLSQNL